MQLTDDQKQQIGKRLAEGAGVADIQRLITEEFKIQMTYMEVRFLLDDLDLNLAEAEPAPEEESREEEILEQPAPSLADSDGSVRVEVDSIKRPGAALSGSVVFSDGVGAKWYVDPYGRLGLDPDQPDYQPSPEDIQAFQSELQEQMQGPGV